MMKEENFSENKRKLSQEERLSLHTKEVSWRCGEKCSFLMEWMDEVVDVNNGGRKEDAFT